MSALALADIAATDDLTAIEVAERIGRVLAYNMNLRREAEAVNLDDCERSLREAARTIMDLWAKTQSERRRRGTITHSRKRPALA